MAVIATGQNKVVLELTTDKELEVVAGWMDRNGLTLAAQKTKAVMLTTKRGCAAPSITVNGIRIEAKEGLKYLGLELCRKLGFRQHIKTVAAKAGATAEGLARILPNVGCVRQGKRKLLATVVTNQFLYAAPIWAGALVHNNNVRTLERPQRRIAV